MEFLQNRQPFPHPPHKEKIKVSSPGLPLTPAKLKDAGNSSPSQLNWRGQQRPCTRCCADKRGLWAPNASRIRSPHMSPLTLLLLAQEPSYIFLLQKTSGNALAHSTLILTTQDAGRNRHADLALSRKGLWPVFCPRASSTSRSSFPPLTSTLHSTGQLYKQGNVRKQGLSGALNTRTDFEAVVWNNMQLLTSGW